MIVGVVNDYREAIIHFVVRGPAGQEQEIEAVVDTGFNGSLSLPPAKLSSTSTRQRFFGTGNRAALL